MTIDLFSKIGRVTYMAIFDCEWHSLTENVSFNLTWFPHKTFLFTRNKIRKIQNTENEYSNGLFTNVRLMMSFLTHHQRPTDYTIKRQQRYNGTKNINIIILL